MKRPAGVTWLEVLVTVAIIAILLAMLLPKYTGNVEHARANEAFGNLKLILAGQRVYRLKAGAFLQAGDVASINQLLRLKLEEKHFTYAADSATGSTFTARATRKAGAPAPYNDDAYAIREDGVITAEQGGFAPPED